METIKDRLSRIRWDQTRQELHDEGFVKLNKILSLAECTSLINGYDNETHFRKKIIMERYRFGKGEYKYFQYPLPDIITNLRTAVYMEIAPVANAWMQELDIAKYFPDTHEEMLRHSNAHDQTKCTVLVLKYGAGGFNTLHQDLYGEIYFPMQMVLMLNEPGKDYTGGEFVLTEQIPRAQSKANVLTPGLGDMIIFTTNFRPAKGTRGYYRVNMKHGVSPIHTGHRHSLGIIFHDALT